MGVSLATFSASFIKYRPGVVMTLNNTSMARQIPTGKVKWEGDRLLKKVHVKRNIAITSTTDGGAIPNAGQQTYVDSEAYRKFRVGAVRVTDGILNNASTTENAAITVVKSELEGLLEGMRKREEFEFTRDGTGVVALVGSTTSGATFTVTDGRGLWEDKDYEIRSASTGAVITEFIHSRTARALTAAGEVTVTPSATLGADGQIQGDYIVWGTGIGSAYGKGLTGLDLLIDDNTGTFQTVNCTTYPRYTSPVLSAGGVARPLTSQLYRQALAMIKQESGADASREIIVLTSVWDAINHEELHAGEVRITPETKVVGLSLPTFQTMFGKVSLMTAADTQWGKMFFVDRNEVSRAEQAELDWRRSDGGGIFERDNNSLGYVANAIVIDELFIDQRNRCAKIEDLKVSVKTAF